MFRLRRTDDSKLTNWFFEVDRKLLSMTLVLIGLGIIFAVSAGSATAAILHKPWYFFVQKGLPFYLIGVASLVICSMLNTKWVLRLATAIVVVGLLLLAVTVVSPHVVKGSKRFVSFFGFNIMPADIIKPGFIVLTAWFLAKMRAMFGNRMWTRDALRLRWLSWWTYLVVVGPMIGIIFKHPDVGSTLLYVGVISIMLVLAGLPWKMFFALIGVGIGLLTFAYYTMDHVHGRINALITGDGDNYQVTQSVQAIQHGGLLGRGDDAFIKRYLPDAHTDFIFAAISEDLGALIAWCGCLNYWCPMQCRPIIGLRFIRLVARRHCL